MRIFWLFLGVIFLGGCLVRTYTVEKPRVDLDVEGNRGYLIGTPKEEEQIGKKLPKTRKITVIEIEFGPHQIKEERYKEQEKIEEEKIPEEETFLEEEVISQKEEKETPELVSIPKEESKPKFHLYVIQENDTLEKISYKFYGTVRKWRLVYEANKDVLKRPDRIYPGIEIKIPILEEEK
jgi:nucleoid-associated protein YgaU